MNGKIIVHGMILSSSPVGEADRRVVILTGERGKITAFARGARKPHSPLSAATRPYAYGEITLFEGRTSYAVDAFDGVNYFDGVVKDLESSCYASYFMEFAAYYTREGLEARETIRLLYASLLALEKGIIPRPLIRKIFELRLMTINGEYSESPFGKAKASDAAITAWNHSTSQPLEKLFTFNLEEGPMKEFSTAVENLKNYFVDYKFKSLEILENMI